MNAWAQRANVFAASRAAALMHTARAMKHFKSLYGAWAVLGLALPTGCGTFRTIDSRFAAQPQAYRRVLVLPVALETSGKIDEPDTNEIAVIAARSDGAIVTKSAEVFGTNEVQRLALEAAPKMAAALSNLLCAKGYQLMNPVRVLSSEEDRAGFDEETRGLFREVREQIHEQLFHYAFPGLRTGATNAIGKRSLTNAPILGTMAGGFGKEDEPFHFQMKSSLAELQKKLHLPDADALLWIDSSAFFESPADFAKAGQRIAWNSTGGTLLLTAEVAILVAAGVPGGGLLDPFMHSASSIQHTITLVDFHTQEVLWFDERHFPGYDARNAGHVKGSVKIALRQLPAIKQKKQIRN